jgi:hypothetical protein
MQHNMLVSVYVIPGGESASVQAYDELELLLEKYPDLFLSIYRGMNRANGQWVITLIGEEASCARYQRQIQQPLEQVQAELISVPSESLAPLIKRFLKGQAEMAATKTPFLAKYTPMSKRDYSKQKKRRRKKR